MTPPIYRPELRPAPRPHTGRSGPFTMLIGVGAAWVTIRLTIIAATMPAPLPPPGFPALPPASLPVSLLVPGLAMAPAQSVLPPLLPQQDKARSARLSALPASTTRPAGGGEIARGQQALFAWLVRPHRPVATGFAPAWQGGAVPMTARLSPLLAARAAPLAPQDRWTLSTWLLARSGGGADTASLAPGSLGASQAGARGAWRIDRAGHAEAYVRVSTSGRIGDGAEGAAGIALRPFSSAPVQLAVERRESLAGSGARSAMAVFVAGGVSDMPVARGWRLDAYGAAGAVGLRRRDGFAEASAAIRRAFTAPGHVEISGGGGTWAAVQPGLSRIDIGPSIAARVVRDGADPRLTLDWRQRVAGNAAPASGIALTLGVDF